MKSKRIAKIQTSATVAMAEKARQMRADGVDVISLAEGEPDFPTPRHITEAGITALMAGDTHYVSSRGIPELLNAVSDKYEEEQGLTYAPEREVLISPGGKMSLYAAVMAVVDPGDEVLILDPAWVSYTPMVQLAGGVARHVSLCEEDNFKINEALLREKITRHTKAIIINSPGNPTGRVITSDEREALAQVAIDNDLIVISDEIYEYLLYDGHRHKSVASLPGMQNRTIIINGFSKAYAMTGWRLGFAVAPAEILKGMLKVQQHSVTCAASFAQAAAVSALKGTKDCIEEMLTHYRERRELIVDGLNRTPGVTCKSPEGSFYVFPSIKGTGMSSAKFADMTLKQTAVVMTPGNAFGQAGEGHVRLSFAFSTLTIKKAVERMQGMGSMISERLD